MTDNPDKELRLLKLILSNDLFNKYKSVFVDSMFPGIIGMVYNKVEAGHEKYARDLSEEEIKALIQSEEHITTARREAALEILTRVQELPPIGADVADDVIRNAWRYELGRQIIENCYGLIDGKAVYDEQKVRELFNKLNSDPQSKKEDIEYVPTDITTLLSLFTEEPTWKFNIKGLQDNIGGISPGELSIIMARPELGKTLTWISLACNNNDMDGWCKQGASVHALCNEEFAKRNMLRAVCCASDRTVNDVRSDPTGAASDFAVIRDRINMLDAMDWSLTDIQSYVDAKKPDILVIDQLDKVRLEGYKDAPTHERLRALYSQAREIAKRNSCAVVGISQASADAEGKDTIDYSMLEGSKTGKAAEADLILGVGRNSIVDRLGQETAEVNMRCLTASKNKISGWHGQCMTKINPFKSQMFPT